MLRAIPVRRDLTEDVHPAYVRSSIVQFPQSSTTYWTSVRESDEIDTAWAKRLVGIGAPGSNKSE